MKSHIMEQKPVQISSRGKGAWWTGEFCAPTAGKQSEFQDRTVSISSFSGASQFFISTSLDQSVPSSDSILQGGLLCVAIRRLLARNGCCQSHVYMVSRRYYPSLYRWFHSLPAHILKRENVTPPQPTDDRPPQSSRARPRQVSCSLYSHVSHDSVSRA